MKILLAVMSCLFYAWICGQAIYHEYNPSWNSLDHLYPMAVVAIGGWALIGFLHTFKK